MPKPLLVIKYPLRTLAVTRSRTAALSLVLVLGLLPACVREPIGGANAANDDQFLTVDLTASTPASLPPCTSALSGTTAYVTSPTGLWSCQNRVWVPIPCTNLLGGAVAYASQAQTLVACVSGGWIPISVPQGPQGASGTLLSTNVEPAGANCLNGGQRIDVGTDTNKNGTLDQSESLQTAYVCNGATGREGPQGDAGPPGPAGVNGANSLVASVPEPPGANCNAGGMRINLGLDVNASGVLDPAEITAVSYACNGAPGRQGDAGTNGISTLVTSIPEPAGGNCAGGGVKLSIGPDANGDGLLDAGEVTSTSFICNGSGAAPRVARFDDAVCDPSVLPDADHGVFVDGTNGDDNLGTGQASAPFKSLDVGIATAVALGKTSLYLNEGTYVSAPTLPPVSALYIEGSWKRTGSDGWQRDCATEARKLTVIKGPVIAKGMNAGLRSLTVQAEGRLSNIAVTAVAGGLAIRDAVLLAGLAKGEGNGAPGTPGTPGTGTSDECGTGTSGTPAVDGAPSTGGTFMADGTFVPGRGGTGIIASEQDGQNGHAGFPAQSCDTGISCNSHYKTVTDASLCGTHSCNYDCNPHSCGFTTCYDTCQATCANTCTVFDYCTASTLQTAFVKGPCGVGGRGGGPGAGGGGGGASVALVVASGASVNLAGSALFASGGGRGTPGGVGGPGGAGSAGATDSCTDRSCAADCSVKIATLTTGGGEMGGDGAPGPAGGSGAGGPSFGVVKLGAAAVRMDDATRINIGLGGPAPSGGTAGQAALIVAIP